MEKTLVGVNLQTAGARAVIPQPQVVEFAPGMPDLPVDDDAVLVLGKPYILLGKIEFASGHTVCP